MIILLHPPQRRQHRPKEQAENGDDREAADECGVLHRRYSEGVTEMAMVFLSWLPYESLSERVTV